MYGQHTQINMPDYSNYDLWDHYMGKLWQGLIAGTQITTESTLVEIGPGATSKIASALSNLNFSGKFYIIEPHPKVSRQILQKYQTLLPKAQVILLQQSFQQTVIDDTIHAVLANHIFDDLLSADALQDSPKREILFQDISTESEEALQILNSLWKELQTQPDSLAVLKQRIKRDLFHFLDVHCPKTTILSQYPSSYFDKNGLSIINMHSQDCFRIICRELKHLKPKTELQSQLNQNENYGNSWIGEELLNADHWIINEK